MARTIEKKEKQRTEAKEASKEAEEQATAPKRTLRDLAPAPPRQKKSAFASRRSAERALFTRNTAGRQGATPCYAS